MGWRFFGWLMEDRRRAIAAAVIANLIAWPVVFWLNIQFVRWAAQ